jgi:hypothetical protein
MSIDESNKKKKKKKRYTVMLRITAKKIEVIIFWY